MIFCSALLPRVQVFGGVRQCLLITGHFGYLAEPGHVELSALCPLGIESGTHRDFSREANERDVVMARAGAALNAGIDVLAAIHKVFLTGLQRKPPVLGIELI